MDDSDDTEITSPQAASAPTGTPPVVAPEWKPLTAKQRRVLGTLMEKSKTTPDAYPMTFAGLCTGCNQKSNRAPISNYSSEQVETIVDELRAIGALTIVQGLGRNTKVRHYAYNWLGISRVEAASDDRTTAARRADFGRTSHTALLVWNLSTICSI